ncbi:hypothetical protein L9F63_016771, partial [Diploptera punctata]
MKDTIFPTTKIVNKIQDVEEGKFEILKTIEINEETDLSTTDYHAEEDKQNKMSKREKTKENNNLKTHISGNSKYKTEILMDHINGDSIKNTKDNNLIHTDLQNLQTIGEPNDVSLKEKCILDFKMLVGSDIFLSDEINNESIGDINENMVREIMYDILSTQQMLFAEDRKLPETISNKEKSEQFENTIIQTKINSETNERNNYNYEVSDSTGKKESDDVDYSKEIIDDHLSVNIDTTGDFYKNSQKQNEDFLLKEDNLHTPSSKDSFVISAYADKMKLKLNDISLKLEQKTAKEITKVADNLSLEINIEANTEMSQRKNRSRKNSFSIKEQINQSDQAEKNVKDLVVDMEADITKEDVMVKFGQILMDHIN